MQQGQREVMGRRRRIGRGREEKGKKRREGKTLAMLVEIHVCVYMMKRLRNTLENCENRQPPGIELEPLT